AETNRIQPEKDTIGLLRTKLLGLGFTDAPLAELEKIAHHHSNKSQRARAAQVIALWNLRQSTPESCKKALTYIDLARPNVGPTEKDNLLLAQLFCYAILGDHHAARHLIKAYKKRAPLTADLHLVWTNFQSNETARITCINEALALYDVPAVALMQPCGDLSAYDRLKAADPVT